MPLFNASTDEAKREAIAALSQHPNVPSAVAFFIACQPISLAAPFLIASKCLDDDTLITIARTQGAAHARAIVRREDLSPTVASVLELQPGVTATMPDAEGVVMSEMFSGAAPPPFPLQRSEPRVASAQGFLHVVWSERRAVTGERDIWYQRLNPAGITSFTIPAAPPQPAPIKLSLPTDVEMEGIAIFDADLVSTPHIGGQIHIVWLQDEAVVDDDIYFSHFRIAELFLESAVAALRPGGRAVFVTKQPRWFEEHMTGRFERLTSTPIRNYVIVSGLKPR